MAKKKAVKIPRLPKWAWWAVWFVGVLASLFIIAYASAQIWLSTWKTYKINNITIKVPNGWDVRDTGKDLNKGQFITGYQSIAKIGDSSTDIVEGPDNMNDYRGNLLIYVFKDNKTGAYYTEIETSGDSSTRTFWYKFLGKIVTSGIVYPIK